MDEHVASLKAHEARLVAILDNMLDGVITFSQQGVVDSFGKSAVRMFGYSAKEVIGNNFGMLLLEAGQQTHITSASVGDLLGTVREVVGRRKDGTFFPMDLAVTEAQVDRAQIFIGIVRDITKRKAAEAERDRLLKIIEETTDYIGTSDLQGHLQFHNAAALRMLGLPDDTDLSALKIKDMHPEWAGKLVLTEGVPAVLSKGFWQHETALLHKDGHEIPVSQILLLHRDAAGEPEFLSTIIRDITERKQNEEKLQKGEASLRAILDNVPYLIWLKDLDGRFIAVNKAFLDAVGRNSIDEVLGRTDSDLWPKAVAEKYQAADAEVILSRQQKTIEEMSLGGEGVQWVEIFRAPILSASDVVLGTIGLLRDVTDEKQLKDQVQHMAHHDPLTELPNRKLLSDRLHQAIALARREKKRMAVMFVDLDNFKTVNDNLGHATGDLLLRQVALRLQACVRESDTIARIGGDEFIVLLLNIDPEQDAMLVAEKIRHSLNQPYMLADARMTISSSIGIAIYPEHGADEMLLLKNADAAMYNAKLAGRNDVRLYQPDR